MQKQLFYLLLPWQNETLLCALKRVLQYPIKVRLYNNLYAHKKACTFSRLIQPCQYLIQHILLPFKMKSSFKKKFDEFGCANFSQFHAFSRSQTFSPFCKKKCALGVSIHNQFHTESKLENKFSLLLPSPLPLKL